MVAFSLCYGPCQTWNPQHVETDEHVRKKAVGSSRNVLEKPTFPVRSRALKQGTWLASMFDEDRNAIRSPPDASRQSESSTVTSDARRWDSLLPPRGVVLSLGLRGSIHADDHQSALGLERFLNNSFLERLFSLILGSGVVYARLPPGGVQGWRAYSQAQPGCPTRGAPSAAARQLHLLALSLSAITIDPCRRSSSA